MSQAYLGLGEPLSGSVLSEHFTVLVHLLLGPKNRLECLFSEGEDVFEWVG